MVWALAHLLTIVTDQWCAATHHVFLLSLLFLQYLGDLGADFLVFKNDEKTVDEIRALNPAGILVSPGPGVCSSLDSSWCDISAAAAALSCTQPSRHSSITRARCVHVS
jgi:hypothetical protein